MDVAYSMCLLFLVKVWPLRLSVPVKQGKFFNIYVTVTSSKGGVAYVPLIPIEGGVAYIPAIPSDAGVDPLSLKQAL